MTLTRERRLETMRDEKPCRCEHKVNLKRLNRQCTRDATVPVWDPVFQVTLRFCTQHAKAYKAKFNL